MSMTEELQTIGAKDLKKITFQLPNKKEDREIFLKKFKEKLDDLASLNLSYDEVKQKVNDF